MLGLLLQSKGFSVEVRSVSSAAVWPWVPFRRIQQVLGEWILLRAGVEAWAWVLIFVLVLGRRERAAVVFFAGEPRVSLHHLRISFAFEKAHFWAFQPASTRGKREREREKE